jgi:negative regulator of flagellin synthesis FlgM
MDKHDDQGARSDSWPANQNGDGTAEMEQSQTMQDRCAVLTGNNKLMEQVRQIISATPEVRPEKVAALKEAIDQGTYEIDIRKLANTLITKLLLDG